jgi:hypothetical protein
MQIGRSFRRPRSDRACVPAIDGRLEPRVVPADIVPQSYVSITVGGQETRITGGGPALLAAIRQAQADGQVVQWIFVKGHGNPGGIQLSNDPDDWLEVEEGRINIDDQDVTSLLAETTGPGTQIWLTGCGSGPLASDVSGILDDGVIVVGNNWSKAWGVPWTSMSLGQYVRYRGGEPL